MRIVLDTNTVISGHFWTGAPRRVLLAAIDGTIELFTSPALLAELEEVLQRPKFSAALARAGLTARGIVLDFAAAATVVVPIEHVAAIEDDPDDNEVLSCALAAGADAIVSGDRHLLGLAAFRGIPVLSATALLARLAEPE